LTGIFAKDKIYLPWRLRDGFFIPAL